MKKKCFEPSLFREEAGPLDQMFFLSSSASSASGWVGSDFLPSLSSSSSSSGWLRSDLLSPLSSSSSSSSSLDEPDSDNWKIYFLIDETDPTREVLLRKKAKYS
jgi:hypothetical protein